jgi:hypothetical protein
MQAGPGTERLHCGLPEAHRAPEGPFAARYLVRVDGPLTLAEQLLLLTGDTGDQPGDQPLAWALHYGVAGALLAELEMAGRLGYSADGRVTMTDPGPTRDDELDAVLAEIAGGGRGRRTTLPHGGLGKRDLLRHLTRSGDERGRSSCC